MAQEHLDDAVASNCLGEGPRVVLESGHGPVPSLAEAIAGRPIQGSWWAHPKADTIFLCSRAVRQSADVLVCRLVGGKVTFVHRRLWPALARLAGRFDADRLGAIEEVHTPSGKHALHVTPFPAWVSENVSQAAANLTEEVAASAFPVELAAKSRGRRRRGRLTNVGQRLIGRAEGFAP